VNTLVFELLLIRQAIILAGCGAAAYTDTKTGLILDKITYPMIALGILFNIIEGEWLFLLAGVAVFAIGYLIYYMGKIGGGDVKILTGMVMLLPVLQGQIFVINALFAASLFAVTFYSAYYLSKYVRKGIDWEENKPGYAKAIGFGAVIAIYLVASALNGMISIATAGFLALPLTLAVLFIAFERGIRKSFFLKNIAIAKLEEDEVIAAEFLEENVKKKLGLTVKGVFGEKEIEKMKKIGLSKVPVYRNMPPFAPFILLGSIAAILQPDLISLLFA